MNWPLAALSKRPFFNGRFIVISDYVRMEVTLVGASWVVVAGDQIGCGLHSYEVFVENRVAFRSG